MNPVDVQAIELVVMGWTFGILTCLLYVTVQQYVAVKRRNRTHQQLLDAGMDPVDVLKLDT